MQSSINENIFLP